MVISASQSTETLLKIGQVATESNLSVKTIRYYEEVGLLTPTVERSPSGYRLFRFEVLNRLSFIKRAQSLGLSLNEIQHILEIHDQGQLPCGEVKQQLEAKIQDINRQIEALKMLKGELLGILSGWHDQPSHDWQNTICPNLQRGHEM